MLHRPRADGEPRRSDRAGRPDAGRWSCGTARGNGHDPSPFPGSTRQLTLGADKGFDAAEFVADLRQACVTPHVAQKTRYSAIDGRTTDTRAGALSIRNRKRIEEAFGWAKTVGGMAQTVYRGLEGALPLHPDHGRQQPRPATSAARSLTTGAASGTTLIASTNPKPNAADHPEGKPFRLADFFTTIAEIEASGRWPGPVVSRSTRKNPSGGYSIRNYLCVNPVAAAAGGTTDLAIGPSRR